MKPCGVYVATLKIHRSNTTKELDFQIVETVNKPLLSAEACVKLGLLKLSLTDTTEVNSMVAEPVKSSVPLTREKILADYKCVRRPWSHRRVQHLCCKPKPSPSAARTQANTCNPTNRSQGEDRRVGEERHHSKGDRTH